RAPPSTTEGKGDARPRRLGGVAALESESPAGGARAAPLRRRPAFRQSHRLLWRRSEAERAPPAGGRPYVRSSAASSMAASVTSAAATMSLIFSHSAVVWLSRIPVPRFTTSSPRRL